MCRFDDLHDVRRDKHSVALLACGLFENPLADQFLNVQLCRAMGHLWQLCRLVGGNRGIRKQLVHYAKLERRRSS